MNETECEAAWTCVFGVGKVWKTSDKFELVSHVLARTRSQTEQRRRSCSSSRSCTVQTVSHTSASDRLLSTRLTDGREAQSRPELVRTAWKRFDVRAVVLFQTRRSCVRRRGNRLVSLCVGFFRETGPPCSVIRTIIIIIIIPWRTCPRCRCRSSTCNPAEWRPPGSYIGILRAALVFLRIFFFNFNCVVSRMWCSSHETAARFFFFFISS